MRNHALSLFQDLKTFYRWKETQVANYQINYQPNQLKKKPQNDKDQLILNLPGIHLFYYLFFFLKNILLIGRHHNEIQYSTESARWHLPIVDRNDTWLCLSLISPEEASNELPLEYDDDVAEVEDIEYNK